MSKRKQQRTVDQPNLEQAVEIFGSCACSIYALDDIGRRFADNPFSPITMAEIVMALSEMIRTRLLEADAALTGMTTHKAHIESAGALDILQALDGFMISITADNDLMLAKQTAGMVIYDFTVKLAIAIERAQIACGARSTDTDYLSNSGIDPSRQRHQERPGIH